MRVQWSWVLPNQTSPIGATELEWRMREWEVGVQWNRLGVDCDSIVIRNMMIDSGVISLGVEDHDFVIRNRFHFPPILWTLSNRLHFDFSAVLLTYQLKNTTTTRIWVISHVPCVSCPVFRSSVTYGVFVVSSNTHLSNTCVYRQTVSPHEAPMRACYPAQRRTKHNCVLSSRKQLS